MFIYLCQKYNIVYGGDLFTLVPSEMGDPRGWFGTWETIYDPDQRKVQKEFLRLLCLRYKNIPGISWDLFNEPSYIPHPDIVEWAKELCSVVKEISPNMLLTVGGADNLGGVVDYDSPHGNPDSHYFNKRNKPYLVQEMYVDNKENFSYELIQGEDIRKYYTIAIRNGFAGICPWSWTRQMRLRQDSYEHHFSFTMEKWDDRLGMHVHDDGTMKVAGQIFKDISILMKSVVLMDFDTITNKVVTSQGEILASLDHENGQKGQSIYHVSEHKCFAAMALDSAYQQNKTFVCGAKDAYVYFICQDKKDFFVSKQIFLKSEKAGRLLLDRTDKPKSITLMDISPSGNIPLEKLTYKNTSRGIEMNVTPAMSEYWIEIKF
jgi:hypothetical protein